MKQYLFLMGHSQATQQIKPQEVVKLNVQD